MVSYAATAGGRKLTPEERRAAQAANIFVGANKSVADAYGRDPKTAIAKALATQAGDTTPVAAGGWGLAEGLGRVGAGFLGKMATDRNEARYAARDATVAKLVNEGNLGKAGGTPEEAIAAGLPSPQAMDEVASAAQQQPIQPNPAAAAAPTPPPQAAPPPVAPPGTAPGVPPPAPVPPPGAPPPVDPAQAAAIAGQISGPPPGAPPPNPIPAPAPMGRGAAPSAIPARQLPPLTPEQGSLGGAEDADTLAGGTRSIDGNNPAGIVDGAFARSQPGYKGANGKFAAFDTLEAGANAQKSLLRSYIRRGYDTPAKIAARWAPKGDGKNDPSVYANTIASQMGIGPDDKVTRENLNTFAAKQAQLETGGGATDTLGGGDTNAATGQGDMLAVPDLPPEEAAPKDIPVRARVRSERLALARQLLQNNPNASAVDLQLASAPLFEKGFDEEQKGREEEYSAQNARDNLRTQSEWQGYEQRRSRRAESPLATREEIIKENLARGRGAIGQRYDIEKLGVTHGYTIDELREKDRLAENNLKAELENKKQIALAKGDMDRFKILNSGPMLKELGDTQKGITAKDTNVGIAGRILEIVNKIDPSGVTNSGWTGSQKAKYSAEIAELQGLQNKIVFGDAGGKLGGNFSNTDLGFIQAMNPVGPGTPVPVIRRTARMIQAASKRDVEYGNHMMNSLQDGTRPQFTKDWNVYRAVNPVFDAKGNVRDDGGLTFDKWVEAGKPLPKGMK